MSLSDSRPTPTGTDHRDAVPARRTLLIGTALSVRQLHHTLAVADPAPRIVGCLLPASALRSTDLPCAVIGHFNELARAVTNHCVEQVLLSLPMTMNPQIRELAQRLDRLGVAWRFMPTLGDQLAGRTTSRLTGGLPTPPDQSVFSAHGPVDPTALIQRQAHPLDEAAIRQYVAGQTVLITGAGGSIGAELARTVCRFGPARLLLVERGENALFQIDRELDRVYPDLPRHALLHDVTHAHATRQLVQQHRPDVIFHAAAHKHVPMMEDHPSQAVENNFFGTRSIADAADAVGVSRFVMISTDKAVNPTSVMGATKRLAELYIQHLNQRSQTTCCMVRFGNVLGSACSVLTIWADQLAHGGPITVTHPEMTRYFMTIPEAAGLVLQAGALAGGALRVAGRELPEAEPASPPGGEVFLLDMGQPVRILDLARRFVRAQGYEPDVDVPIRFTGIRPGEKLFEELAYAGEDMLPTAHASIRTWRTSPPPAARMQQIVARFDRLRQAEGDTAHPWQHASRDAILNALRAAVPEMVTAVAG